jgi:hypothetical protein
VSARSRRRDRRAGRAKNGLGQGAFRWGVRVLELALLLVLVAVIALASRPHHVNAAGPIGTGWQNYDLIISPGDWDEKANLAPDVIARRPSDGSLWLFSSDGTGGYTGPTEIGTGWNAYRLLAGAGSFRAHNAPPDLLAVRNDGDLIRFPDLGHGKMGTPVDLGPGWGRYDTLLATDFNGDRIPDLIARNAVDGSLTLYAGDGHGGLLGHSLLTSASFSQYSLLSAPGDWDNDGYPDLLARSPDGTLCLFRGDGRGALQNTSCIRIGSGWRGFDAVVTPGTWDEDDQVDLLARTPNGSLWLATGAGISGYSDPISVRQCSPVTLHVSSRAPNYTINFMKFGQANPQFVALLDESNGQVRAIRPNAGRDGADWQPSATYSDTCSWTSGIYAAQLAATVLVGSTGASIDYKAYVTFVVRPLAPPTTRQLLVVASTNTWTAYNDWPQRGSFYSKGRPTEVSYLRPNPGASPLRTASHLAGGELEILQWLSANNFAYQLVTDVDLNDSPSILSASDYYAVLLSTHSEYWTDPMYDALAKYLKNGGSVLSLSGNTMYREEKLLRQPGEASSSQLVGGTGPIRPPYAVGNLLGLHFDETHDTCASYHVVLPKAWLMAGVSARTIGAHGKYWAPACFLNALTADAGASGYENDVPLPFLVNRRYQIVAVGNNVDGASYLVWYRRRDGGQVVNVGSMNFGNSLAVDPNLSRIVKNALANFQRFKDSGQTSFGGLVAPGDWDGDGHADLLARRGNDLYLYRGNGRGQWLGFNFMSSGWARFNLIAPAGKWTGSSRPDLFARRTSDGALFVEPNDGFGDFKAAFRIGSKINWSIFDTITGVGDWNGDGIPDLIALTPSGSVYLYKGAGGGQVRPTPELLATGWDAFDQIIGNLDWNGDGLPDLIARKPDGSMWIALGRRDHTLAAPEQMPGIDNWDEFSTIVGGGDWNSDGHQDLLARREDGVLVLVKGHGATSFESSLGMAGRWNDAT